MKRKILLIISLFLLVLGLSYGILYINNPQIFSNTDKNIENQEIEKKVVKYPVYSGEIIHTYEVEGSVISDNSEQYIVELTVKGINNNFELLKKKGEVVAPQEVFYKYNGKDKAVDFNALIVDIIETKENNQKTVTIKLLNYDALYVVADIDSDKYEKINYNTEVKVVFDTIEYSAEIINIGYEIVDGKIPVCISLPQKVLPGSKAKIIFKLDVEEKGLYVPKEAVYKNGNMYYVKIINDLEYEQIEIEVGQEFSLMESGNEFEYIEVLSGISEEDVLIVEYIDDLGKKIKEKLSSE